MSISLIIPTYRNPKYLDLCLKSATENMVCDNTEIIVIVDGYIEESQEVLDKYPNIHYLDLEQNKGMQYALNIGAMQARGEYLFVINDDNVFGKEWDKKLTEIVEHTLNDFDPKSDVYNDRVCFTVNQVEPIGPSMFNFVIRDFGKNVENFQYDEWLKYEDSISRKIDPNKHRKFVVTTDGGIFPFLIKRKYYMAVCGLDTWFNSPNVCDWDFFLRLQILGFSKFRLHNVHLYHFGSVATKKNADSDYFIKREIAAHSEFEFKWGFIPFNEPFTNNKIPENCWLRN